LADIVIANSRFTRDSYATAGWDVSKVRVVPLGAPPVEQEILEASCGERESLRVLWAGAFSVHKGAHYLLSAWKRIAINKFATLDIYGTVHLPDKLLRDLPRSICAHSAVARGQLFKQYARADVLVFPTLCDGFGMVVTEALAHGLPVITTKSAGAADLIRHGENGLVIPAGDVEALAEALEWCLTHRTELRQMRQAALDTARRWQWCDFRRSLSQALREGLQSARHST
jgi:glycosyltransferase involved in cell wall biosynthesis